MLHRPYRFLFLLFLLAFTACQTPPPPAPPAPKKESLMDLVENQNLDKIREIFGFNTDPNSVNAQGQTALHVTALKNLVEIATVLLVRGSQVDARDTDGNTPLFYALQEKSPAVVGVLVQYKASLFQKNNAGRHPLHLAQEQGLDTLKIAVTAGNVNTFDENGNTPLHYAAAAGLTAPAEYYLTLGADPRQKNNLGETALDVALKSTKSLPHAQTAKALLMQGAPLPKDKNFEYLATLYPAGNLNTPFDQGSSALHLAASRNHLGIIRLLLQSGAVVDSRDFPGNTPLHKAVEKSHLEAATILLDAKADVGIRDFNNNSTLHLALTSPLAAQTAELLLNRGVNPDLKNNYGNSPLHLAISLDLPLTVLDLLLRKGADPNVRNKDGNTPLLEAVVKNQKEHALALLKAGASLFATNNTNVTPLSAGIEKGNETLAWLVTAANVKTRDDGGNTPLHEAVSKKDYPEAVTYLLGQGAAINDRNRSGSTPLHLAIGRKSVVISRLLLTQGADWYIQNNDTDTPLTLLFRQPLEFVDQVMVKEYLEKADSSGATPLFFAIATGNLDITENLLKKGANLQAKSINGSTPLHEAVRFGQTEIAKKLLASGARVNETDNLGNTPLHNLVYWDNPALAELLLASGAQIDARNLEGRTPLGEAVRKGDIKQVQFFLSKKSGLLIRDNYGRTPLYDAVLRDNLPVADALITAGALVQIRDNTGNTPLHLAAARSKPELNALILRAGADLFAENQQGQTPIAEAIRAGVDGLKALLDGRSVNLQNNQGSTPLHLAVEAGAPEAVLQYLIGLGADVNARNKNGKTPLDLALNTKNTKLAELLMASGALK